MPDVLPGARTNDVRALRLDDSIFKASSSASLRDLASRCAVAMREQQRNRWPQMGQLFVEKGRLTSEQLESALEQQRETGEPLGEILVARDHISRIDLAAALTTQWSWQGEEPAADNTPEQPVVVEPVEATASYDQVAAVAEPVAAPDDGVRVVAELQARLRAAYEQLAAAETRLGVLEPAVSDLTKAFGVLNAQLHARAEELAELRAASAKREAQITAAAQALLG
jgi:hypothetical protein